MPLNGHGHPEDPQLGSVRFELAEIYRAQAKYFSTSRISAVSGWGDSIQMLVTNSSGVAIGYLPTAVATSIDGWNTPACATAAAFSLFVFR